MLVIWTMSLKALSRILPSPTTSTISSHTGEVNLSVRQHAVLRIFPPSIELPFQESCIMSMLALLVSLYCYRVDCLSGSNSITLAKRLLNWHPTTSPHLCSDLWKADIDTVQEQITTTCFTINFIQNILTFLSLKKYSYMHGRHIHI